MCIAPGGQRGVFAKVLFAYVMAACEGDLAVDDHNPSMVAKIQTNSVSLALRGVEWIDQDQCLSQFSHVGIWQFAAPQLVIEHVDTHAFSINAFLSFRPNAHV